MPTDLSSSIIVNLSKPSQHSTHIISPLSIEFEDLRQIEKNYKISSSLLVTRFLSQSHVKEPKKRKYKNYKNSFILCFALTLKVISLGQGASIYTSKPEWTEQEKNILNLSSGLTYTCICPILYTLQPRNITCCKSALLEELFGLVFCHEASSFKNVHSRKKISFEFKMNLGSGKASRRCWANISTQHSIWQVGTLQKKFHSLSIVVFHVVLTSLRPSRHPCRVIFIEL